MRQTDQMLARYAAEIEERQQFIDGLVEAAEKDKRDLSEQEMELVTRARERLTEPQRRRSRRCRRRAASRSESANQVADMHQFMTEASREKPREVELPVRRRLRPRLLAGRPRRRRGAASGSTSTSAPPPTRPPPTTRACCPSRSSGRSSSTSTRRGRWSACSARAHLPSGSWSRPKITQNTQVGVQSAEKTELASRKMTIGKVPVTAKTYGGYVNVSRQDIDWTQPSIMDLVINDLAGQYAIETENAAADDLTAGATAGPTIPTGAATAAAVAAAFWTAAGSVFTAMKGQGRLIAVTGPDMLGHLRAAVPAGQPAERAVARVQRQRVQHRRADRQHRRDPGLRDRRAWPP